LRIEIVAIGEELLKGRIVNTNAAFLSKQLQIHGYRTLRHTTLPDAGEALSTGLQEALSRSDVVIATGGLGPTLDDGTREVAAEIFGSDFAFNQEVANDLKRRYGERYGAVEDQARLPVKAAILPNSVGSAPGLVFSDLGKTLILLPGVPQEMEPLFSQEVLPLIRRRWPAVHREMTLLSFCLVYESLLDPTLRKLSKEFPSVEVGIYPSAGTLLVSLSGEGTAPFCKALLLAWSSYHYLASTGKIAEALVNLCKGRGESIACAESCTGGRIASFITEIPGASECFLGSLVTYSNPMKCQWLNVREETLSSVGAVSAAVVSEMLAGVFENTSANWGIAVSGIAGPTGGSDEKPIGTIFAAIGRRGENPDVGHFSITGDREKIMTTAAQCLIGALWRKIDKGLPAFPFF
jgi:nicotinamide-nucleotide amidase